VAPGVTACPRNSSASAPVGVEKPKAKAEEMHAWMSDEASDFLAPSINIGIPSVRFIV
jgi:hypothetical protein